MRSPGDAPMPAGTRVSIFMPVYDGAAYLPATLEALLVQTFHAFELIVVDDGSHDGSADVVEKCAGQDPRVRLIRHERNLGAPAARNSGWRASDPAATYLMDHDCDDLSAPTKLERLVSALDRRPEWSAVGCFCRYIDPAGRGLGWPLLEWRPSLIRRTFDRRNSMVASATLFRRELLDRFGPFRSEYSWCDDYDFFARALAAGRRFANVPAVLHAIRLHARSIGATRGDELQEQARRVTAEYRRHVSVSPVASSLLAATLRLRMLARRPGLLRLPLRVSHLRNGSRPTRNRDGGRPA